MATNPMKRKSRIAFIVGFLIALLISLIIICLLYTEKNKVSQQLATYKQNLRQVYVLNQDVKSGQVLTPDMFRQVQATSDVISTDVHLDIYSWFATMSLSDKNTGTAIALDGNKYYVNVNGEKRTVYVRNEKGELQEATSLIAGDKAYYYEGDNNTVRKDMEVIAGDDTVVAKIDLKANTVLTQAMLTRNSERVTNDVRKEEYNVIDLPIDLFTGDYIDIRLMLPNGQNYIVVSKKQVTIPMSSTGYSADTIQINLTEEEILLMSSAIVENYKIQGSKLYATRYVEAGMQDTLEVTYEPSTEVAQLIRNDANVIRKAIKNLNIRRNNAIDAAANKYGDDDAIVDGMTEDSATSQEARKEYLESLGGGAPVQ